MQPLVQVWTMVWIGLSRVAINAFSDLKQSLAQTALQKIKKNVPFTIENNDSDVAVSATLNQKNKPVAFYSRILIRSHEQRHPAIDKEATAIIEAVRKWSHFLLGQHFTLITEQRSVAFMCDTNRHSKVKNEKIQRCHGAWNSINTVTT